VNYRSMPISKCLSLLGPRYYSISSSPSGDAARCSVTCRRGRSTGKFGRGVYKGVCCELSRGRRAGDTIHAPCARPRPASACRTIPCADHHDRAGHRAGAVRGFLQERADRKAKGATLGAAMLFFGCRIPSRIISTRMN